VFKEHFPDDQFENHRADGKRKLKPNAVPYACALVLQEQILNSSFVEVKRPRQMCQKSVNGKYIEIISIIIINNGFVVSPLENDCKSE
jgi:hypothetical protein